MNQQIRSIIFGVAGLLVLAGAVLFLTHWAVAPYLFAAGAAGISRLFFILSRLGLGVLLPRRPRFHVFFAALLI